MRDRLAEWSGSEYRVTASQRWTWRPPTLPKRSEYYARLCRFFEVSAILPRVAAAEPDVGFLVPIAAYGGAEKVAYALAQTLRRTGRARTHLFVLGAPRMRLLTEFSDAFDTINFLADESFPVWGGRTRAFGQPIFLPGAKELHAEDVSGLLLGLDLIVNCQSAPANSLVGALRKLKVKTISYVHLFDYSAHGRPAGHAHLAVSFEHAYDLIVACSRRLAADLHSLGVPADKVLAIPNAAGFSAPDALRAIILPYRRKARGERRLRCLYIGRLDRQKGVERLYGAARALVEADEPVQIRIIGSTLVDERGEDWAAKFAALGIDLEKPVYASHDLAERYAWADVLLLPSRWEGAPLVIPECQQIGCIPIAADVGAVSELISDGEDGFLVGAAEDGKFAADMAAVVSRLLRDDALRVRVAEAAIARGKATRWEDNFAPLLDWFDRNVGSGVTSSPGA